jgi:hypothetical protein
MKKLINSFWQQLFSGLIDLGRKLLQSLLTGQIINLINFFSSPMLFIKIFHCVPLPSYQKTEFTYTKTDER